MTDSVLINSSFPLTFGWNTACTSTLAKGLSTQLRQA